MTDLSAALERGARALVETAFNRENAFRPSEWVGDTVLRMRPNVAEHTAKRVILAFLRELEATPGMKAAIAESCQKMHGTDTEEWKACAWDKLSGFNTMITQLTKELK